MDKNKVITPPAHLFTLRRFVILAALCGALIMYVRVRGGGGDDDVAPSATLTHHALLGFGPAPPPPLLPLPQAAAKRPLTARIARPRISAWQRANLRVTVETWPWPTGGPEGLAQLLKALSDWGVPLSQLFATQDVNQVFGRYTQGMPIWSGQHARGDILVTSEYAPCPLDPRTGVRQVAYELSIQRGRPWAAGVAVHEDQAHCSWIGHSHFTRVFASAPSRAVVRQWYDEVFGATAAADAHAAAAQKVNTVVVDHDFENFAAAPLRAALAASHPNATVTILKDFSRAEVNALFRSAKVIVDGAMTGMEHPNAEATIQWAVPVMQGVLAGADTVDYPHEASLRFGTVEEMVALVRSVLTDYETYAVAAATNRVWHLQQREVQLTDVARFFDSAGLSVHVLACSGGGGGGEDGANTTLEQRERAALLVAAAVYLAAPLAAVTVHVQGGGAAAPPLLAEAAAGTGLFQHANVTFSSPLCALSGDGETVGLAAVALESLHPFGRPEHIALLSWRTVPVAPAALAAWASATRDGAGLVTCGVAPLRAPEGVLGVLLDASAPSLPEGALTLLCDGTFSLAQLLPHACEGLASGSDAPEGPVFVDALPLLRNASVPLDTSCKLVGDEMVLDVVSALETVGLAVPAAVLREAGTCARGGAPRAVTSLPCANEAFSELAQRLSVPQACP